LKKKGEGNSTRKIWGTKRIGAIGRRTAGCSGKRFARKKKPVMVWLTASQVHEKKRGY